MDKKRLSEAEESARYGAKANFALGLAQAGFGIASGNIGFIAESAHQASDSGAFLAKANAMKENCSPKRAKILRKLSAYVLVIGGAIGIGGGISHFANNSTESNTPIDIGAAVAGAAVNTAIVRKTHSIMDDDHDHAHSHAEGAVEDTKLHAMADAGTGILYAGALASESVIPGIANYALLANGGILALTGSKILHNIKKTDL